MAMIIRYEGFRRISHHVLYTQMNLKNSARFILPLLFWGSMKKWNSSHERTGKKKKLLIEMPFLWFWFIVMLTEKLEWASNTNLMWRKINLSRMFSFFERKEVKDDFTFKLVRTSAACGNFARNFIGICVLSR